MNEKRRVGLYRHDVDCGDLGRMGITVSLIDRTTQLMVVDEGGNDVASCMLFKYGDRWQMFNIRGRRFSEAWPEMLESCEHHGMKELSGYVTPAHARLVRMGGNRAGYEISISLPADIADRPGVPMCWVTLRRKKGEDMAKYKHEVEADFIIVSTAYIHGKPTTTLIQPFKTAEEMAAYEVAMVQGVATLAKGK